jgi:hypothetical protein
MNYLVTIYETLKLIFTCGFRGRGSRRKLGVKFEFFPAAGRGANPGRGGGGPFVFSAGPPDSGIWSRGADHARRRFYLSSAREMTMRCTSEVPS